MESKTKETITAASASLLATFMMLSFVIIATTPPEEVEVVVEPEFYTAYLEIVNVDDEKLFVIVTCNGVDQELVVGPGDEAEVKVTWNDTLNTSVKVLWHEEFSPHAIYETHTVTYGEHLRLEVSQSI